VLQRVYMEIKQVVLRDGYTAQYRFWGCSDPDAVIIYLHGIQSHSEWFTGSCTHIAQNNFAVYAPDRRGSGLNYEARGDCSSYATLIDDVKAFIDLIRNDYLEKPIHIIGVSWGGKLAVMAVIKYPRDIKSVILVSPGLKEKVDIPLSEKLSVVLNRVFCPKKMFKIPIACPEMFTSNPHRIEYIERDTKMLSTATARLFFESARMGIFLDKKAEKVNPPVFLMLAEIDNIVDNDKIIKLFKRFSSVKKSFVLYPGAHHTLEFEKDVDRFYNDIICWLNQYNKV